MSINRVARYMKGKEDKVAVLVGTVTNDVRLLEVLSIYLKKKKKYCHTSSE